MIPDKLWSDCGDDFNSTMMKDLCETLNSEIATGPDFNTYFQQNSKKTS